MKQKLRAVLLGLVSLSTFGAMAQTDVTSTYLTNANFESATAIGNSVCTYAKDTTTNKTSYARLQTVTGWTPSSVADASAGAAYAYGGTPFLGGSGYVAPTADNAGVTGNALGIVNVWGAEGYYYQAETDMPAGSRRMRTYCTCRKQCCFLRSFRNSSSYIPCVCFEMQGNDQSGS